MPLDGGSNDGRVAVTPHVLPHRRRTGEGVTASPAVGALLIRASAASDTSRDYVEAGWDQSRGGGGSDR